MGRKGKLKRLSEAKEVKKDIQPCSADSLQVLVDTAEQPSSSAITPEAHTPLTHSLSSQPAVYVPRQLFPSGSRLSQQRRNLKAYVKQWTTSLGKDDVKSLAMTLYYVLVTLNCMKVKQATAIIGSLVGKSDRTINKWKSDLSNK